MRSLQPSFARRLRAWRRPGLPSTNWRRATDRIKPCKAPRLPAVARDGRLPESHSGLQRSRGGGTVLGKLEPLIVSGALFAGGAAVVKPAGSRLLVALAAMSMLCVDGPSGYAFAQGFPDPFGILMSPRRAYAPVRIRRSYGYTRRNPAPMF